MTARYALTAPAEQDLEDIFFEVAERHGRVVAERVFASLLRAFDLLANNPEVGRHRPELWPPPYRFWPTGPAYIAYRGDVKPIRIIRIARASRDWSRFSPTR
ncbi:MAG: type II toxin-antitoxin system RelE/ParE family toxin [Myxococcota bacterium]|nr:type II toxin-antitoxin system RelE/ParE family toxin [Myxococcota bacterium]